MDLKIKDKNVYWRFKNLSKEYNIRDSELLEILLDEHKKDKNKIRYNKANTSNKEISKDSQRKTHSIDVEI